MPEKRPQVTEFEIGLNTITHVPTGATWTTRGTELRAFKPRRLGIMMGDGNFYSEQEVQKLAAALVRKPPPSLKEVEEKLDRRSQYVARSRVRGLGGTVRNDLSEPVQADEHDEADNDGAQ